MSLSDDKRYVSAAIHPDGLVLVSSRPGRRHDFTNYHSPNVDIGTYRLVTTNEWDAVVAARHYLELTALADSLARLNALESLKEAGA